MEKVHVYAVRSQCDVMQMARTPGPTRTSVSLGEQIIKAPLRFPPYMSTEAKDVLKRLLQRDVHQRLGAGRAEEIKVACFLTRTDPRAFRRRVRFVLPAEMHFDGNNPA